MGSIDDALSGNEFAQHRYVFDQFNGLQLELINALTQSHPIRTPRDVETYLARLALVAARIDEGIAEARAAAAAGIVPPRIVLERSIGQLDGFLKLPAGENVYVTTLATRLERAEPPIPQTERDAALAAARRTVTDGVIPAYGRLRDLLREQLGGASTDAGVWRLPRGDAYYARQLATYTNTTMTAEEIHQLGLREVARLRAAGEAAGRSPHTDPGGLPEVDRRRAGAVKGRFRSVPRSPIEVRREPPFSEATAAAHYTDPAPDGSRPGVFWVPLPGPNY